MLNCQVYYTRTPSNTRLQLHKTGGIAGVALPAKRSVVVRAKPSKPNEVSYGANWYEQTRARPRTVKEEIEYRREANRIANNGRERKDLYTDNWDGSEYKGSSFNILTVILAVSVAVPALGLAFAYATFGTLWG